MNVLNRPCAKALCGLVLGMSMVNLAKAQLSLDASGGVFSWSIARSGHDGYSDQLVREPGPAWVIGLHCVPRPDSSWTALSVGLRYERREFDVDYGSSNRASSINGVEYVRLGSLYIDLGLNIKMHSNGRWWARPMIGALCYNEGVASGWSKTWSYMGSSGSLEYDGKLIRRYGAPFFLSLQIEHLQPLGPRWFVSYRTFVAQSLPLKRNDVPFGVIQYQFGVGVGVGFRFGEGLLADVGHAFKRDREQRNGLD